MSTKKEEKKEERRIITYVGYLLMQGGDKIKFDTEREEMDFNLLEVLDNGIWNFEDDDMIWIPASGLFVPAKKVIGVYGYDEEE